MNSYLEPIFKIVIPAIEGAGVSYWVFGGVAIAGAKGYFYRKHQDVDIFVLEKDYEETVKIIKRISKKNSWQTEISIKNNRPKIEISIAGEERLSLVPIYKIGNEIEFIFPDGFKKTSRKSLKPIIRRIGRLKFVTPSKYLLKKLLLCRMDSVAKSKNPNWNKYKQDAEQLLGIEETKKFFQKI